MAENRESIILQVGLDSKKVAEDLAKVTKRITELKSEQKKLNEDLKAGTITEEDYGRAMAANSAELTKLTRDSKGYTAVLKQLDQTTGQYGDSLSEQQRKLNDMQRAYDNLSKAQRESEGGKQFLKQIQEQDKAVKEMEESTGRAGRSVGSYADAMQKAGVGLGGFTAKMRAMLANPMVAVFTALVAIFQKLRDAFKRNDDAGTKLQKAFAAFKPILTAINKLFSGLADVVASVAEKVGKFARWFGGLFSSSYNEAAEATQNLVEAQDKLETQERQLTADSARRAKEVAKLREAIAGAADEQQRTVEIERTYLKISEERAREMEKMGGLLAKLSKRYREVGLDMAQLSSASIIALEQSGEWERETKKEAMSVEQALETAIAIEKQELQERLDIARKKVEIQKQTMAENDDYSDEAKDQLAQLIAAMYNAETEYYTGVRKLDKEFKAEREKKRKEREEQEKKAAATRLEIERATEDKLLSMETDATKKQAEQAKIAGQREVENLRIKLDNLKKEDVEARKKLQELIAVTEKATQKQIDDIQFKAEMERQETLLAIKRDAAKRGIKDSVQLAQMQVEATQEDYARLQALTNDQITTLYGSLEKYAVELNKAETAAFEARETLALEEYNRKMQRMQNEYDARLIGIENEYALAELEYEQKQQQYEALVTMDDEMKARLYANEEEYKNAVIQAEGDMAKAGTDAIRTRIKSMGLLGETMNSMASALQGFADESEEAAKAQKVFALSGILLNQAQSISEGALAIAEGVRSAAGIPFPANIPAIISVVAQVGALIAGVMTSISQAKQIFSQAQAAQQFAHGGVVGGNSYTGDKILIRANSGEGITTGKQANNLLQEIANNPARGGLDYERITDAFASAVAALPAPVMVYQEYKDFEQNVSTFNEIASI